MNLSPSQQDRFNTTAQQMVLFIQETCNPHVTVLITSSGAELLEGVLGCPAESESEVD